MGVNIPCDEIGGDCHDPVTGSSLEELVNDAGRHLKEVHPELGGGENPAQTSVKLRAAIPQTARPPRFRTVRPRAIRK